MADRWMLRGTEFENCNCAWGCPCQFGAKSTQGHCEAFMAGHIEEGTFNDTNLDGLNYAALMYWPGEVHEGNGTQQVIIDERADPTQREALRKILHGESTAPGATHFFVYNAMMSTVLDTLYASIDLSIDVDQRTASLTIEGLVESRGTPLPSPLSAALANRIRLNTPDGPRYIYAEMGKIPEAQAEFEKSAQLDPANAARAYYNLGAIMTNSGKLDEAAAAFKKATEVDPKYADAYFLEAQALRLRQFLVDMGEQTRQGAIGLVIDRDYLEIAFPLREASDG